MNAFIFPPRYAFITFVLILVFANAACASAPQPAAPMAPAPSLTQSAAAAPTSQPTQIPAIPESRRLTLEFPAKMRAGVEGDIIRLTLEVDDLGNVTPTAQVGGNVVVGETVQIPNLYETHQVTAEAKLDLAGFSVQPPDAIYEPLKRGQSVTFYWSVRPQETGKYRGIAWLHLNFENRLTGEKDRVAISAQRIEIEAVDFFGMSVNVARASGAVGSIVGGVIGFPFLEDIVKFVFKRKKKKKR
ncbi:MAG: hypothetical protein PHQ36_07005 [Anaerolineales bacterium]|nr:hypothetical protein [Anaerolineales bacterium]